MSKPRELTEDEIAEYKMAFSMFDTDGNGTIDVSELTKILAEIGQKPTEEEVKAIIAEVDADENGTVDFSEFLTMMSKQVNATSVDAEMKEAFKMFDTDGSGKIDRQELAAVMKKLGEELTSAEITAMINDADLDNDGEVSFEEFKIMMTKRS